MKPLLLFFVIRTVSFAATAGFPETIFQQPVTTQTTNQFVLGTLQAANAPGVLETNGVIGGPVGISNNTVMLSWPPPSEAFSIYQVGAAGLTNRVFARRGMYSTYTYQHPVGQLVWIGPGNYFRPSNPSGNCEAPAQLVLPVVTIPSGIVWNCPVTALTWEAATFGWDATTVHYNLTTTWAQTAGAGQSKWTQGITWDEDVGWWDTTTISWRSL